MAGDRAGSPTGTHGGDGRRRTGAIGEAHAAGLIEARGGAVISRNWRSRTGELDLVALDAAGRLRFVEVRVQERAVVVAYTDRAVQVEVARRDGSRYRVWVWQGAVTTPGRER